jgi:hypothetical protein
MMTDESNTYHSRADYLQWQSNLFNKTKREKRDEECRLHYTIQHCIFSFRLRSKWLRSILETPFLSLNKYCCCTHEEECSSLRCDEGVVVIGHQRRERERVGESRACVNARLERDKGRSHFQREYTKSKEESQIRRAGDAICSIYSI